MHVKHGHKRNIARYCRRNFFDTANFLQHRIFGVLYKVRFSHKICQQTQDSIYQICFEGFMYVCVYIYTHPCLWVPVTKAWRVLRLQMEERPLIWRAAANKLNKQSRTADKGWSSSLGVGQGANNSSSWKDMVKKYPSARCFFWRQNNPEVKSSPTRISRGECF